MRFRKRAKVFPGFYLNFSKSGISTTIGRPGLSINVGKKGTRLNVGIPGTGIYDQINLSGPKGPKPKPGPVHPPGPHDPPQPRPMLLDPNAVQIKSEEVDTITSSGLADLHKSLAECREEKEQIKKEIRYANSAYITAQWILAFSYLLLIGLFVKWFRSNVEEKKKVLYALKDEDKNCVIDVDITMDEDIHEAYQLLTDSYKEVLNIKKIWDITSVSTIDQRSTRSAASEAITRREVRFGFAALPLIRSKYKAMHLQNANGGDLYLYPGFLLVLSAQGKMGFIDLKDLRADFRGQRFIENGTVPEDSKVIDHTWAKVNKNGSPDRRYAGNYQIPICQYGELELKSKTGLHEVYAFSNYAASKLFGDALSLYKQMVT